MQPLLSDLLELLRYELEKYYELLKILYAERSLLVERKVKELEVLIKEEETTIQKIQRIEITRDELLAELSTELEIGDQPLNASTLTELADEPLKSEYRHLFARVERIKREFEFINDTNKQLLQSEQEYVSFLVDEVVKIDEPGDTYQDDGFCITTTEVDEFTSEKTLLLWLGWTPTRGNKVGLVHTQFFLDIAKENGYAKLELRSKIKEIGKYLIDAGWSIDTTIYSRRV